MQLVKPSYEVLTPSNGSAILRTIEAVGRTCYKSEDRIDDDSAEEFCRRIVRRGHLSVIEHVSVGVRFVANRGFTHELVRHRLASYSQESTRYCNYGGGVSFIVPPWVDLSPGEYGPIEVGGLRGTDGVWARAMMQAEASYRDLLLSAWTPQQARGVLPIDLKTEIVMTANIREWRHVFSLRCGSAAHPQMRELMAPLQNELRARVPVLFDEDPTRGARRTGDL